MVSMHTKHTYIIYYICIRYITCIEHRCHEFPNARSVRKTHALYSKSEKKSFESNKIKRNKYINAIQVCQTNIYINNESFEFFLSFDRLNYVSILIEMLIDADPKKIETF